MKDDRVLKPNEASLYRRTFLARVNHGASVEAADRQALHACTIWEHRGVLNDDGPREERSAVEPLRTVLVHGQHRLSPGGVVYRIVDRGGDWRIETDLTGGQIPDDADTWPIVISSPQIKAAIVPPERVERGSFDLAEASKIDR